MKELDFDELDRAVNSLMTEVPKTSAPQDDEVKTLTITPSPGSTPVASPTVTTGNSSEAVSVTSSPSVPARTSTPISVAARRGGRFMDVVHPSSDMKKVENNARPVSRQGATISPSASSSAPVEPSVVSPSVESKKPEMSSAAETSDSASEWPDPLELADFKDDLVAEAVDSMPAQLDKTSTNSEPSEEISPLTSPFLPGTKVEKRPLGGAVTPEEDLSSETNLGDGKEKLTVDNPDDQLPATPSLQIEATLPEELQGDLVAIESGAAGGSSSSDHDEEATKSPDSKPVALLPEEATPDVKEKPSVPAGPVSIPQQYREEPSTGETANGSIYDTDTYHQPLAHPAKKKTGWLWVVWIVLILAVGAGIGAALYFLRII